MFQISRRGFMVGCSAAIASMAGGRLGYVAFGSPEQEPNQDICIVVFLRGAMDGLSAVAPIAGDDRGLYEASRNDIALPISGANAALPLNDLLGIHAAGAPLHELYQDKKLAVIHAAGLTSDTRSHFDAMQYMELGTPGSKTATSGWLTRHLQSAGNLPADVVMPALSVGNLQPTSLAGSTEAIGMTSPNSFNFGGNWRYSDGQRLALRKMYTGSDWLHTAGLQTLDAIDVVEYGNPGNYTPENGAVYPNGSFSTNLKTIAQMIKLQLGLQVATVDLGGWDTHEYQGDRGGGYFSNQLGNLAGSLAAFMTDLSNSNGTDHTQRITIVVMSEFGRTFKQNASRGTDHGHGNVMFVLGGQVNGGAVYGSWPGLSVDQLYDKRDLAITTDYRRVLSEILIRRLGNNHLGYIFPGYTDYQPLGIVRGTDLTPDYGTATPTPTPTPLPGSTIPTGATKNLYLPIIQK
ncbi:MAG: DUF1501 domain-containing protein [Caldilineaceae bacterium]